jgi:glucose-6-phosphate-specific signal transduction histidine kinase
MAYGTYDKSRRLLNTIFPGVTGDLALEAAAAAILDDLQVEPITVTRFGFVPTVAFD